MSPILEKKIIQKYGLLLDKIVEQDILFEFGDGWFEIIDSFCFMATHMMSTPQYLKLIEKDKDGKTHREVTSLGIQIIRAEEIGGGLSIEYEIVDRTGQDYSDCEQEGIRARANMTSSYIGALADICEYNSSKTCEQCGVSVKGPRKPKCKTLCPDHQEKEVQDEHKQI
jgi:arginine decarboxylase-like protein